MTTVSKRDGRVEELNFSKLEAVVRFASEGLDVDVVEVLKNAKLQFTDKIKTTKLHKILVNSASELITFEEPDYQYLAARLELYNVRKEAFGSFTPPTFKTQVNKLIALGKYGDHLLNFTDKEFTLFEQNIKHERDNTFSYAAVGQLVDKYLVRSRLKTEESTFFESPQFMYMAIGCTLIQEKDCLDREDYINKILKFYEGASTFKFSLPTPIMAGARTPTKQFSSCVLLKTDDSLDSINATSAAVVNYVSKKAGIGIDVGKIRPEGSGIRGSEVVHTGVLPFIKYFTAALKSCSQGGVRNGSATLYYPMWHKEFFNLIVLKNSKGIEENRERRVDYSIQLNGEMVKRLLDDDYIYLFSPHEFEEMYECYFTDQEKFSTLYKEAITLANAGLVDYERHKAVDVWNAMLNERMDTGRIYLSFVDNMNNQSPFSETIYQSNLCVAPETVTLTREGYIPIAELEDQIVDIWNGEEWSEVLVSKTGEDQKLLKVTTTTGYDLECTPYHKFYVFNGYGNPCIQKQAKDLEVGDKLMKFDLPVIQGTKTLDKAYLNGFYSGDGCSFKGKNIVYLYEEKRKLSEEFKKYNHTYYIEQNKQDREVFHMTDLKDKFFVPTAGYTVESRLDWLSGWLDADGCIYRNGTNEAITGSSINKEFLKEVQFMLQSLGVSSKVVKSFEEGLRLMPANDGSEELKEFFCQDAYRLLITSYDSFRLLDLGLEFKRLSIKKRRPQRDAKHFIKIESVVDEGRVDDTYCFNEPKRHTGMFNGILTGQCKEIALPTKGFKSVDDEDGRIALCTLASFNLGAFESPEEMEEWADILVLALDGLLSYQDYPMIQAELFTEEYRSLGIGIVNLAHLFAREGVKYGSQEAFDLTNRWFEHLNYYLTKASVNLAKISGSCTKSKTLCYGDGIFPFELAKDKVLNLLTDASTTLDWEGLRVDVKEYGIRNATLMAVAPTESSAQVLNACNGVEMPRSPVSIKSSKSGMLKQVIPDVKLQYEYLWDNTRPTDYLKTMAVIQRWVDQAISTNTFYNPHKYLEGKVDRKHIIEDIILFYSLGGKTLYYNNVPDTDGSEDEVCDTCHV